LEPGTHDLQLKAEVEENVVEVASSPLEIRESVVLVSQDGQVRPRPENVSTLNREDVIEPGDPLIAIGWITTDSVTFAQVRVPGSRELWWVNISSSGGSSYASLEAGDETATVEKVRNFLPELPAPEEIAPTSTTEPTSEPTATPTPEDTPTSTPTTETGL
jgi:hypothetical protein